MKTPKRRQFVTLGQATLFILETDVESSCTFFNPRRTTAQFHNALVLLNQQIYKRLVTPIGERVPNGDPTVTHGRIVGPDFSSKFSKFGGSNGSQAGTPYVAETFETLEMSFPLSPRRC